MNAVQSTLSSPRASRLLFWFSAAVLAAGVAVLAVKLATRGSDSAAPPAAVPAAAPGSTDNLKPTGKIRKWSQVDPQAKVAVERFLVDAVAGKNLARGWRYMDPELRGGFTFKEFTKGDSLPIIPFPVYKAKSSSYNLLEATPKEILAEVGVAATPKSKQRPAVFLVGAKDVATGSKSRWLVNYWMPRYTPPVRADPATGG